MDHTVHGILQAGILEWVAFLFSRGSSQARDQTQVSRIASRFFTSWTPREAQEYWSGSLSLLQWVFPTQELNQGLLHCRWILYQLSYDGSPWESKILWFKWLARGNRAFKRKTLRPLLPPWHHFDRLFIYSSLHLHYFWYIKAALGSSFQGTNLLESAFSWYPLLKWHKIVGSTWRGTAFLPLQPWRTDKGRGVSKHRF